MGSFDILREMMRLRSTLVFSATLSFLLAFIVPHALAQELPPPEEETGIVSGGAEEATPDEPAPDPADVELKEVTDPGSTVLTDPLTGELIQGTYEELQLQEDILFGSAGEADPEDDEELGVEVEENFSFKFSFDAKIEWERPGEPGPHTETLITMNIDTPLNFAKRRNTKDTECTFEVDTGGAIVDNELVLCLTNTVVTTVPCQVITKINTERTEDEEETFSAAVKIITKEQVSEFVEIDCVDITSQTHFITSGKPDEYLKVILKAAKISAIVFEAFDPTGNNSQVVEAPNVEIEDVDIDTKVFTGGTGRADADYNG